ncbi:MAG: heavy-metal-associated domain-containing protein [Geodermatophilaceae bacterium]|nr:heavy-metal-associated domain-containing protein [Geodermatophilaceae bacterium]
MTTSNDYTVTGMTCAHCVAAVSEEIGTLEGVMKVSVDLVEGGESTVHVTSETPLDPEQVRLAVDEAGYRLTGVS